MSELITDHEAALIIENEGIGYAVCHYCDSTSMKNPETERLWLEASKALEALAKHLGVESY